MNQFGEKIKKLREQKGLLQRQVANQLEMDTPMLSKIERGERNAKRQQVSILSKIFNVPEDELISLWLCDKVIEAVDGDPMAKSGIKKALTIIKN